MEWVSSTPYRVAREPFLVRSSAIFRRIAM